MLKISMLRQIFSGAKQIKFIIIIKNPVTLNVATPKTVGWRYARGRSQLKAEEVGALDKTRRTSLTIGGWQFTFSPQLQTTLFVSRRACPSEVSSLRMTLLS